MHYYLLTIFRSIRIRIVLALCGFILQTQAVTTNNTPFFKLSEVIPEGKCELVFMTVQYSERAKELTAKMQRATSANREWFLEYVKNSPDGPLPYNERLGLTKAEYAESLDELKKRQLVSAGVKLPCLFLRQEDTLFLYPDGTDSPLNKIQINLETGELSASVGNIGKPEWISHDGSSGVFGAYEGCAWSFQKSDISTYDIRMVKLEILRQKPSGRILWYFQDSEMVKQERKQSFQVIFQPLLLPKDPSATVMTNATGKKSPKEKTLVFKILEYVLAFTMITSVFTVPVAAILTLFQRTKRLAYRLSQTSLWTGMIAIATMATLITILASREKARFSELSSVITPILLVTIAPVLALFLIFWHRRKIVPKAANPEN